MSNSTSIDLDVIVRLKDLLTGPLKGLKSSLSDVVAVAKQIGDAVSNINFKAPLEGAAAFQQKLLDIAVNQGLVGNAAFKTVADMRRQFQELAISSGQSSQGIADAAGQMIAAGVDPGRVKASIGTIATTATAANADIKDVAALATSLMQNLHVPADQMAATLDGLVVGGKLGAFELKDMAKSFPTLTGEMAKLGITGREAATQLAAMLEIAAKGTASPAEAASNLNSFLSKITSPEVKKNFEKMNVDIEGVMRNAAAQGGNPIDAAIQKISELTGLSGREVDGLMAKTKASGLNGAAALEDVRKKLQAMQGADTLGTLFSDADATAFLIPALANLKEYKETLDKIRTADGSTTRQDHATQMQGLGHQQGTLTELKGQIGDETGNALGTWLPALNDNLKSALESYRQFNAETNGLGTTLLSVGGGVVAAADGLGKLASAVAVLKSGFEIVLAPFMTAGRLAISSGQYFATAAQNAIGLQAALAGMEGVEFTGLARFSVGLRGILMAIPGVSLLGGVFSAVGAVIAGISAPIWGVIAAVAGVALAIYRYWEPISNFVEGFASAILQAMGNFQSNMMGLAGQKLLDFAQWLGIDEGQIASVINGVMGMANRIVAVIKGIPGMVGNFLSDLFSMKDYSAEAEAEFRASGENMGNTMVKAIQDAFDGLVNWFTTLPARIKQAIGKIDFSSILPSYVVKLLGLNSQETSGVTSSGVTLAGVTSPGANENPLPKVEANPQEVKDLRTSMTEMTKTWPIAAQIGMRDFQNVLMNGGDDAAKKALQIRQDIKDQLTIAGSVDIDTGRMDEALRIATQIATTLKGVSAVSPATPPTSDNGNPLPSTPLPSAGSPTTPTSQKVDVNSNTTVKFIGPGEVVSHETNVTPSQTNLNTGRAIGRE